MSLNIASFLSFLVKPGKKLSECQRHYQHAISRYTPHAKIPQCKPDGSFEPLQCDMSYCYCVDQNGDERPNTRLNVRYGRPVCDETGIEILDNCSPQCQINMLGEGYGLMAQLHKLQQLILNNLLCGF